MRADRLLSIALPIALGALIAACSYDFGKLFDRDDPVVENARHELEASTSGGDADLVAARLALEELLRFRCESDGGEDLVVKLPGASLDLGLVTFRVAELIGQRFGDEESDAGEASEAIASHRARELDCAQRLLMRLAGDPATPRALQLRARYLLGNFAFLARRYKDAIARYDEVLLAHPARGDDPRGEIGAPLDDDAVARDAAWNRAIALKRLEDDKKDSGEDADAPDSESNPPDAPDAHDGNDANDSSEGGDGNDGGGADGNDGGNDSGGDGGGEGGGRDAGADGGADAGDGGGGRDGGGDTGGADATSPPAPKPSTPPPASSAKGADLRELDRFEKKAPLNLDLGDKMKLPVPKMYDK